MLSRRAWIAALWGWFRRAMNSSTAAVSLEEGFLGAGLVLAAVTLAPLGIRGAA